MRHARDPDLDRLEDLLARLRAVPGLAERKRGVFYRGGKAFLHFHEDAQALFADIREEAGADFDRIDVTDAAGQAQLLELARRRAS